MAEPTPWLVLDRGMHCRRCGARQEPTVPADVTDFLAELDRFRDEHAECVEREETNHGR